MKMYMKIRKMEPKGYPMRPKWSKRDPKGSQKGAKGAKREPKGSKRSPKGDQRATKLHPKIDLGKRSRNRPEKEGPPEVATILFGAIFGHFMLKSRKNPEKTPPENHPRKNMKNKWKNDRKMDAWKGKNLNIPFGFMQNMTFRRVGKKHEK